MKELRSKNQMLYLNFSEVEQLGVFQFARNADCIKEAYLALHEDDVQMPSSDYLKYPNRPSYDRIIPLLGYLGGSVQVSGIKVVGSCTTNHLKGLPRASALIVLNDPDTQRPFCIMEGSQISAARTALVTSISIARLAPSAIEKVAVIGCGYLARIHLIMWAQLFRDRLAKIHVYDLDRKRVTDLQAFAQTIELELIATDSAEEAIREADIVIPLTTNETPYIQADWIKPNSLYTAVSLLDPKLEVLEQSDFIVVDNLDTCLHEGRPLQQLESLGRLDRESILTMGQVLAENLSLRGNVEDRVFFNPMGTVITDLALSYSIFKEAQSRNVGTRLEV